MDRGQYERVLFLPASIPRLTIRPASKTICDYVSVCLVAFWDKYSTHDAIGIHDGPQPVGNDKLGDPPHFSEGPLNNTIRLVIYNIKQQEIRDTTYLYSTRSSPMAEVAV